MVYLVFPNIRHLVTFQSWVTTNNKAMAALYIYHSCQYICITMSYIRSTRTSAFKNKRDTAKLPLQVILLLTIECTFPWILKNPWHYWFKIFKSISLAKNDISLFYFPNYKLIWSFLMLFGHLYAYEFSIYRFWFYFPSCWLSFSYEIYRTSFKMC